ncbi:acyltransferase family protein [Gordonia sp. YY1]|uniref:acyltransferase family protein n=1 Tax=Gordonia sp. YY1 TaxID=396712 RepID=UPI0013313C2E|nr:acyltransferase [Gordonia sp. YY1]KAF0970019.1 hypothetical protein BPODLACK_01710 [Gordonia sp. YY1]
MNNRVAYLDGIRACAALYVLIHHAFMTAYPDRITGVVPGWTGRVFGWAIWGHFGVTVFIVLAGYSLALGVAKHGGNLPGGFRGYMTKRSWRIIPAYWIALAATIILSVTVIGTQTGTHWDQSAPSSPKGWLVDFLLLQDIVPVRNAAYTFWSISVEYHIYLLLPLMLLVWRRINWPAAIAAGVLVGVIGIVAAFGDERIWRLHPSYYLLFALAAGACICTIQRPDIAVRIPWRSIGILCAATGAATLWVFGYARTLDDYWWLDVLFGIATICLIVSMQLGRASSAEKVFNWRPFATASAFSYTLYLIHAQLLQVFWQLVIRPFNLAATWQLVLLWLVACPLIVLISWGAARYMEAPFVRLAAKRSRTGTTLPGPVSEPR